MRYDIEEVDIKLMIHVINAMKRRFENVRGLSSETDVKVLLLHSISEWFTDNMNILKIQYLFVCFKKLFHLCLFYRASGPRLIQEIIQETYHCTRRQFCTVKSYVKFCPQSIIL